MCERTEVTAYRAPLANIINPLCLWYEEVKKPLPWRLTNDPYHIWLSEIMLQQTRIEAVIPYFQRFLSLLPTVEALASCPDDLLMKLWEGLGYYSRARNLKKAAVMICQNFNGSLPTEAQALRSLPGIGEYTAGAIASIAFGKPEPAVDGNVLRVMARIAGISDDISLPATKKKVRAALTDIYPSGERAASLTEGLMELGETVCIPNGQPRCDACPLRDLCTAYHTDQTETLPKRSAKKPRKDLDYTVFLLVCDGKIALRKRPKEGLLGGLWEFPNTEGHLTGDDAKQFVRRHQSEPMSCVSCGSATHIFTHLNWNMIGYRIVCDFPSEAFLWVTPEELANGYAIPTAFRYYKKVALSPF